MERVCRNGFRKSLNNAPNLKFDENERLEQGGGTLNLLAGKAMLCTLRPIPRAVSEMGYARLSQLANDGNL